MTGLKVGLMFDNDGGGGCGGGGGADSERIIVSAT